VTIAQLGRTGFIVIGCLVGQDCSAALNFYLTTVGMMYLTVVRCYRGCANGCSLKVLWIAGFHALSGPACPPATRFKGGLSATSNAASWHRGARCSCRAQLIIRSSSRMARAPMIS